MTTISPSCGLSPKNPLTILLLGKNGQVGWELQRSLAPLGTLVALDRNSKEYCGDLTDLNGLERTVLALRPDVIVNAAAYTAVDKAENDADAAYLVNAAAPSVLARMANQTGALLVSYSTDYVFDGSGQQAWTERDPTAPLSVYGSTKLAGERQIAQNCDRHLIFRTSWVFAARGNNFASTILRLARERDHLTVIDDQAGAPTGADLLADLTAHAIVAVLHNPILAGTYHVTTSGETTWHGYASYLVSQALSAGTILAIGHAGIEPVPSTAFPTAAMRPLNSRLDTLKFRDTFGLHLPSWRSGVDRMLNEILGVKT